MAISQILNELETVLSKELTAMDFFTLEQKSVSATCRIVSDSFAGRTFRERIDLVYKIVNSTNPKLLKQYDIALILLSKAEFNEWDSDASQANQKPNSGSSGVAAKEL